MTIPKLITKIYNLEPVDEVDLFHDEDRNQLIIQLPYRKFTKGRTTLQRKDMLTIQGILTLQPKMDRTNLYIKFKRKYSDAKAIPRFKVAMKALYESGLLTTHLEDVFYYTYNGDN